MQFFQKLSPLLLFSFLATISFAQLQSPKTFLGYDKGEKFTPHYKLVEYAQHIAQHSDRVQISLYGKTNQDRPLYYMIISSPANLAKIESIRTNNLKKAGVLDGRPNNKLTSAIIWLSYGVHGNEAGASNSAIYAMYELANPQNKNTGKWLEDVVVILDPALNPDGFNRYTTWYQNVGHIMPNANTEAAEHHEPWPGGRVNHYLFDLNRDWAWATQIETQQRLAIYNQWLPHIHVDFHEMGHNSPYYFAPAAEPYHQYITNWQSDFQVVIGKNHAKHFDKENWLYYTREVFDLFYPSYGDTYPTFNGAIGMTYEQAGHSMAGLAIETIDEDTLILKDRIDHHLKTTLSTVEVAYQNREQLNKEFSNYFEKSKKSPQGKYKTYVIKGNNHPSKLKLLCQLLDKHKIQYGSANGGGVAFDYIREQSGKVNIEKDDLVISAHQPKSVLIQTLFDPSSELSDSLTYDITAWSLPYAFGLEAYAMTTKVNVKEGYSFFKSTKSSLTKAYAYAATWETLEDAKFLAAAYQKGLKVRIAQKPFQTTKHTFNRGTLIFTQKDNRNSKIALKTILEELSQTFSKDIKPIMSGFSVSGTDLGSYSMAYAKMPKIALLYGDDIRANDLGQVWHYFEQELKYPITALPTEGLKQANLSQYQIIIMPSGHYSTFSKEHYTALSDWVNKGGKLIAIENAVSKLVGKEGFKVKHKSDKTTSSVRSSKDKSKRLKVYAEQERSYTSNRIPGAIYKLKIDNTHPLAYGMPSHYHSLKTSSKTYEYFKDIWNVGTIGKTAKPIGFVGKNLKPKMLQTTVFGVENKGQGKVIYLVDNPLFRGFWEQGKFLFSNALFMVR